MHTHSLPGMKESARLCMAASCGSCVTQLCIVYLMKLNKTAEKGYHVLAEKSPRLVVLMLTHLLVLNGDPWFVF